MIPGDDFKPDPIIQRGEALERLGKAITSEQLRTLGQIKEYARLRSVLAEVADDPKTLFVDEARRPNLDGTDYLEEQIERSRKEREAAALRVLHAALSMLEPIALAALKGALDKGIAQIDVPPALRPVLGVVEAAALDAAGAVVKDVTG